MPHTFRLDMFMDLWKEITASDLILFSLKKSKKNTKKQCRFMPIFFEREENNSITFMIHEKDSRHHATISWYSFILSVRAQTRVPYRRRFVPRMRTPMRGAKYTPPGAPFMAGLLFCFFLSISVLEGAHAGSCSR